MAKVFALVFLALFALACAQQGKKEDLDSAAGHHHGHHHGHHGHGHHQQHHGWGWNPHYDFGYKFKAGWGWH